MEPALHQDLVAAEFHGLANLVEQYVSIEHVGFRVVYLAVEGAEIADRRADVGVVDVAVNVVGAKRLWVQPLAHRLCRLAKFEQARLAEQVAPSSRVSRPPSTARCKIAATVEDKVCSFRGQAQAGGHVGKPPQTGQFQRTELIRQDARQVIVTRAEVES